MTTQLIDPNAAAKIEAAKGKLRPRSWGGTDAVCMMSAMVSGAQSTDDCVTDGWPKWLAELNVRLFDADVGAGDEDAARYQFALDVAHAVQEPRDYDKARDLFLIARLDTGEHSALKSLEKLDGDWTQQRDVVERVVTLLHRRIAGENVVQEMKNAAGAARAAARAATYAAYATYAATYAADAAYAAYAATYAAYAATYATYATYAATYAADAADAAAGAATYAAARNDLIAALKGAREMSDDLVKRLRANGLDECDEAIARIEELEAKLAKAVEVAEKSIKWLRLYGADVHREAAALAELTGGKDE